AAARERSRLPRSWTESRSRRQSHTRCRHGPDGCGWGLLYERTAGTYLPAYPLELSTRTQASRTGNARVFSYAASAPARVEPPDHASSRLPLPDRHPAALGCADAGSVRGRAEPRASSRL